VWQCLQNFYQVKWKFTNLHSYTSQLVETHNQHLFFLKTNSICKCTFFKVCRMSGYVNTLVYFYLALVCLFRQKKFLSWNFYPSVFYPKGKNTLVERIHCYTYAYLTMSTFPWGRWYQWNRLCFGQSLWMPKVV